MAYGLWLMAYGLWLMAYIRARRLLNKKSFFLSFDLLKRASPYLLKARALPRTLELINYSSRSSSTSYLNRKYFYEKLLEVLRSLFYFKEQELLKRLVNLF
jgi:hypothetical protein